MGLTCVIHRDFRTLIERFRFIKSKSLSNLTKFLETLQLLSYY